MLIPDEIKSKASSLQIITTNNGNVKKEYQLLISNLLLTHWDGQVMMKVINGDGNILSQGPIDFHLHPLGSLQDRTGSATDMIQFEFDLDGRFKPGLQYFVIFESYLKGNVNEYFSRIFTNFLIEEKKEDPPVF